MGKLKITSEATAALAEFALQAFESGQGRPVDWQREHIENEVERLRRRIARLETMLNFGVRKKNN